jgi:hypothetical protein
MSIINEKLLLNSKSPSSGATEIDRIAAASTPEPSIGITFLGMQIDSSLHFQKQRPLIDASNESASDENRIIPVRKKHDCPNLSTVRGRQIEKRSLADVILSPPKDESPISGN